MGFPTGGEEPPGGSPPAAFDATPLLAEPQAPNSGVEEDGINLEEIREFAKNFKIRRLSLGLTQTQVGQALTATEGPAYSQSAICRYRHGAGGCRGVGAAIQEEEEERREVGTRQQPCPHNASRAVPAGSRSWTSPPRAPRS